MADLLPLNSEALRASASNASSAETATADGSPYRYPPGDAQVSPLDLLTALRRYRAAEAELRKRARKTSSMNDTDLSALRYLLSAAASSRALSAKDLASLLEISSPSVSAMVERLERIGYIRRTAHPTDRRAFLIEVTDAGAAEVSAAVGPLHERMIEVVESMPAAEAVAVHRFLTAMTAALESTEPGGS